MDRSKQSAGRVRELLDRGVEMPHPESVCVADEVDTSRVAAGTVLHPGTRLLGAGLSIGPGCSIGSESPATVEDCQLGERVELGGGFFSGATFLDGSALGSGAHVRPGTLLEEQARAGHTVGFKQTVLLPFVTGGSLLNFCDCLMAGGTGRDNHSEVGSSYVHFNFTPRQDKATASLLGDVPRGVMLDQPPIFLGGQGGLVGPVRIGFGAVIPAGVVYRRDAPEGGGMVPMPGAQEKLGARPFDPGVYGTVDRVALNNLFYVGNLLALRAWYVHLRAPLMSGTPWALACHAGALARLQEGLRERLRRLEQLVEKLPASIAALRARGDREVEKALASQERLLRDWPRLRDALTATCEAGESGPETGDRDRFLDQARSLGPGGDYLGLLRALARETRQAGTRWLQAIVDTATDLWHASEP